MGSWRRSREEPRGSCQRLQSGVGIRGSPQENLAPPIAKLSSGISSKESALSHRIRENVVFFISFSCSVSRRERERKKRAVTPRGQREDGSHEERNVYLGWKGKGCAVVRFHRRIDPLAWDEWIGRLEDKQKWVRPSSHSPSLPISLRCTSLCHPRSCQASKEMNILIPLSFLWYAAAKRERSPTRRTQAE